MLRLLTLIVVVGRSVALIAQTLPIQVVEPASSIALDHISQVMYAPLPQDPSAPLCVVEVLPEYPGGSGGLALDIQRNLILPVVVEELGLVGKVFLEMVVERDGRITNVHVVRGLHPAVDKAVLEDFGSVGPYSRPAMDHGEAVRFKQFIPIRIPAEAEDPDMRWLHGLVGTWEGLVSGERYVETWTCADRECNGRAVSYKGSEESYVEHTRIIEFQGQWLYLVAAGDAPVVCFVRASAEGATWVFANMEHDFPQRISYSMEGTESLNAYIEGPGEAGNVRLDFKLVRAQ